jgi:hypothetical protein
MLASLRSLDPLVRALTTQGYRVVGPTVRDGAIVLAGPHSAEALPYGWGATTGAGGDGGYAEVSALAGAGLAGEPEEIEES